MIKTVKLKSGVTLIMEHMEGFRSSSVGIFCNTGSVNERPEEFGISHFIEHMLFKGTKNRTAFEIVDQIDSVGGEINAFTSKEVTCYYVKCLDEHLIKSCDVLTDMIENPLFDKEEMEKEKLVVIEEINMSQDEPDGVALDVLEEVMFDGSTLSHPVLGTKKTVTSFTQDDIFDYYNHHYTKDSIIVSISGSFDEDEVISYFDNKFLNLLDKQREDDFGAPAGTNKDILVKKDIEQAHLVFGIVTVPATDENRYKLSLINSILGGGMSSRLFQNIREDKGLAYSVYSMNGFYKRTGAFAIYAGVAKDRVEEAKEAIKEEIDRLANEPISMKEFCTAKEMLKSSYIFTQESIKSRMTANGRNYIAYGRCKSQEEVLEELSSITLDDLEKTKKLITSKDDYFVVNVTGA